MMQKYLFFQQKLNLSYLGKFWKITLSDGSLYCNEYEHNAWTSNGFGTCKFKSLDRIKIKKAGFNSGFFYSFIITCSQVNVSQISNCIFSANNLISKKENDSFLISSSSIICFKKSNDTLLN